ncbi:MULTISPECIES: hypothetical protein [unclassified Lacrimispora]|uniref:hypothetical protein n=1 Tax=unclassified Lacrimispora TaxID=2719232 RepID=UPI00376F5DDA
MIIHQVFSQIYEGEIKNIIVCDNYEMANWLTRGSYGDEAFAVDCLLYPCEIGDKYREGVFYRVDDGGNETVIDNIATAEQQMPALNAQVSYLAMMTGFDLEGV